MAGHRSEPLLGDEDTEKPGIIIFSPEGREQTRGERGGRVKRLSRTSNKAATIPSKLREAGVTIKTGRD